MLPGGGGPCRDHAGKRVGQRRRRASRALLPGARALSDVSTSIGRLSGTNPSTVARVTNKRGGISGDADFYAWGIFDTRTTATTRKTPRTPTIRARPPTTCARSVSNLPDPIPTNLTRQRIVFAVNTYNRWSNASTNEFDITSTSTRWQGRLRHRRRDQGAVQTGSFNGVMGSFVFSTRFRGSKHRLPRRRSDGQLDGAAAGALVAALPRQ